MKQSVALKDVYTISEDPHAETEGKNRWTKVGIGFVNRDNSINVILDAIPCNGRLHIRDRQPKKGTGTTTTTKVPTQGVSYGT